MTTPIFNRNQSTPPADGWHQIETLGESATNDGRVQVVDDVAVQRMVAEFNARAAADPEFPGLLVDADHLSHDMDQRTEAFGWLKAMRVGENGVPEGRIDWSDLGLLAITNKRYKFFSTEYDPQDQEKLVDGRIRPLRLSGLALTNRPRRKGGKPISNRQENSPDPAGKPGTNATNKKMKTIAEKLGLPAEATEEQILGVIGDMQSELDKLRNKAQEAEAEEILNRHAKRIPAGQRENWKKQLIANRADTEALLAGLPEAQAATATAPATIHNRSTARTPESSAVSGEKQEEAKARAIRNRAEELVSASGGKRRFADCWSQAEAEASR